MLLRSIDRDVLKTKPEELTIKVEVATIGEQEKLLENLVTNLIIKQEVSHAGWKLVGQDTAF